MPAAINVTDEEIAYTENILLSNGQCFDEERLIFIKNFDTIDLQAVPGSGKTTALLAKLLILEKHLPFENGAGILVISHTNSAIDEIRSKIAIFCPKLFSYPNFVGTIQSFVDTFLAIPYYANHFKRNLFRINDERYNEKIEKIFGWSISGFTAQEQKNARYFLMGKNCKYTYRFGLKNGNFVLLDDINGKTLKIEKPKKGEQWSDFNQSDKNKIEKWLFAFKYKILKDYGVLHYDDAYLLANIYLKKFPHIIKIIQTRFQYVFVDEMQDMDKHQHDLLEALFINKDNTVSNYQRIGDKNQAIFNGSAKLDDIWIDRDITLELKGSYRLTKEFADIVKCFGLRFIDIEGRYQNPTGTNIKPHVIVFDDDSIGKVVPAFANIIQRFETEGKIPKNNKTIYKVIAWRKEKVGDYKLGLESYWKTFDDNEHRIKEDYSCMESYLLYYDKDKKTLESVRKCIINALLWILRYENILDENNNNYTKRKLLFILKENNEEQYEKLKLLLYQWSINIIRGKKNDVYSELKNYALEFVSIFGKSIDKSKIFIETPSNNKQVAASNMIAETKSNNIYKKNGINIEITTIHSVKGQTHTATLYLETFYEKKYESERLAKQFKGNNFNDTGIYSRQTTKMAYVGLSRPKYLLCLAVHKNRFKENDFRNKWEIIDISKTASAVVAPAV